MEQKEKVHYLFAITINKFRTSLISLAPSFRPLEFYVSGITINFSNIELNVCVYNLMDVEDCMWILDTNNLILIQNYAYSPKRRTTLGVTINRTGPHRTGGSKNRNSRNPRNPQKFYEIQCLY